MAQRAKSLNSARMDRAESYENYGLAWPGKLFPFQKASVERLIDSSSVLLADEMAVGKTIQANKRQE